MLSTIHIAKPGPDEPNVCALWSGNTCIQALSQTQLDALVASLWSLSTFQASLAKQVLQDRVRTLECDAFNMRTERDRLSESLDNLESAIADMQGQIAELERRGAVSS